MGGGGQVAGSEFSVIIRVGEVPEWLNGALSKSVVAPKVTVGSNPTLSAHARRSMWRVLFSTQAFKLNREGRQESLKKLCALCASFANFAFLF